MSYMLLIMEPPEQRAERGDAGGREAYAQMLRFGESLAARGVLQSSNALAHPAKGTRVRVREGVRSLTDGPFAEAREIVGGYFLIDVATREEAIAIAAECPAAAWCDVEVRQVAPCYE